MKHQEWIKDKLLNGGIRFIYEPIESRLHQDIGENGQYDISSSGKILRKTEVCWTPSKVDDGKSGNVYNPLFGTTDNVYQNNKGLTRVIPNLAHLRVNVAGTQFPSGACFDDCDPIGAYEI